jgi:hypothetical protein
VAVCLLAAGLIVAVQLRGPQEAGSSVDSKARGSPVAVGDSVGTPPAGAATGAPADNTQGIAASMPEQPLPGQNRPSCERSVGMAGARRLAPRLSASGRV